MGNKKPRLPKGTRPDRKSKIPRVGGAAEPRDGFPVWRFRFIDWDGGWPPTGIGNRDPRPIATKLSSFETMTWEQIKTQGSHYIDPSKIIKPARERLIVLKKEDWFDNLFSLRLQGRERLWGFLRDSVFFMLWWDPNHEICPSQKKHT